MNRARFFLVFIRVFLAFLGLTLAIFKWVSPEANPIFLALPDFDNGMGAVLPWQTNPAFAKGMVILSALTAGFILVATLFGSRVERIRHGHPLPFASGAIIACLFLMGFFSLWYAAVGIVAGLFWGFAFTMGVIWLILFAYEFSQWGGD